MAVASLNSVSCSQLQNVMNDSKEEDESLGCSSSENQTSKAEVGSSDAAHGNTLAVDVENSDVSTQLESLFDDTVDNDEFLGFCSSEIQNHEDQESIQNSVEMKSINEDSNSKTSGYGTSDEDEPISGSNRDFSDHDSSSSDLSDSEDEFANRRNRENVMRQRRGILKDIMSDLRNDAVFNQMISKTPSSQTETPRKRFPRRNLYPTRSLPPVTRRRAKLGDPDYTPEKETDFDENAPRSRLFVRFGPKRKLCDDSDEESVPPPPKRMYRRSVNTQEHVIIPVEDVTDAMLENISKHSVGKEYNAVNGTSCHQCRQKTMDTKSCCRNKNCVGVRGQFCGPCLQNRYGESVRDALLDPEWSCPVCRGFCNCSICRNRAGKAATGILIGLAKHNGYSNVKDYLAGLKSEKSFIVEDE